MAKAWIVPVRTNRIGDSGSVLVCYVAGFSDLTSAKDAVAKANGPGDKIGDPTAISDNTADALKVQEGDVWML